MRHLILIAAYCSLFSLFSTAVQAQAGDPPKSDDKKKDEGDDIGKQVGWSHGNDDPVTVCVIIKKDKRADKGWLGGLDEKINGITEKSDYQYSTDNEILGRVFQCFGTRYGKFLDLLKSHGDGIQGYCDYDAEKNPKNLGYPVINDNDEYDLNAINKQKNQFPLKKIKKRTAKPMHIPYRRHLARRSLAVSGNTSPRPHKIRQNIGLLQKRNDIASDHESHYSFFEKRADEDEGIPVQDTSDLRISDKFTLDTAVISQAPPGDSFESDYLFDVKDGENITVYVFDAGLNKDHTAFANYNQSMGWILAGPKQSQGNKDFHPGKEGSVGGSEVAAKVIGRTTGLARKSLLYNVVPYDSDGNTNSLLYLDALSRMYNQIMVAQAAANDQKQNRRSVICFSHRLPMAARLNEMYRWTEFKKISKSRKAFIDAVTGVMDEILVELGKNPNLALVTRTTGILLTSYPMKDDPIIGWPARRASNLTNMVLVGGVDTDGRYIMYQPPSVYAAAPVVFAPAEDIRVPYTSGGNTQDYYTARYSIRLAVGTVSGVLASMMAKYNESGVDSRARLYANAYPRVFGGGPVVWNGLRIPTCNKPPTTMSAAAPKSTEKPKLTRRADGDVLEAPVNPLWDPAAETGYIEGDRVECEPLPIVAKLVAGKPDKEGKVKTSVVYAFSSIEYTEVPKPPLSPSQGTSSISYATTIFQTADSINDVIKPHAGQPVRPMRVSSLPGPSGGLAKIIIVPPSRPAVPQLRPTSSGSTSTAAPVVGEMAVKTPTPAGTTNERLPLITSMASLDMTSPQNPSHPTPAADKSATEHDSIDRSGNNLGTLASDASLVSNARESSYSSKPTPSLDSSASSKVTAMPPRVDFVTRPRHMDSGSSVRVTSTLSDISLDTGRSSTTRP
ncbi:hypothetical protein Dda_4465 [Drechslerella dactyloides]|uniref:Peptidase S8/S53 domain-containing protein n=1 Tax=Drechslerella dactyloides TaxID=74499 RepID=A0AAD6IXC9_DREDA|nr:hypothetical protein Dda_4465 [Drechslerella dactyloides]